MPRSYSIERIVIVLMLLCATAGVVQAQEAATLRGFVTSRATGEPLQGASVALLRDDTLAAGAATSGDGLYVVSSVRPGRYVVRVSFVGYQTRRNTVQLRPGAVRSLNVALLPTEADLEEVSVREQAGGAADLNAGHQQISPAEVKRIPMPGASAPDLASYLTSLPSVTTLGDQGGRLYIRGGEPTHNLVLLDGIPIYQPFHLLGFYSAFPADLLSQATLHAGAYPARFGGRLASVLDVQTRTGNKKRWSARATASPFVSGARLEGPLYKDRVSVLASARVSAVKDVGRHLAGRPLPFRFGDVFGKAHAVLGPSSRLSVTGLYTFDEGRLGPPSDVRPELLRYNNTAVGGRYLLLPGDWPMLAEIQLSYSRFKSELGPAVQPARSARVGRFEANARATNFTPVGQINWGLTVSTSHLDSRLNGLYQNLNVDFEYVTEAAAYLSPTFTPGGWRIQPGLRVHAFPSKSRTFVEPRLRLSYERGPHRLSAAAGLYHQEIVGLSDQRDAKNVFTAYAASPFGEVPTAWHGLGGYRLQLASGLTASIEGYYKRFRNLYVPEWTALPRFTTNLQQADGRTFGLDVRLEIQRGVFYSTLTYGLQNTRYRARGEHFDLWYGRPELEYRPPHDRRHQVGTLVGADFGDWRLSARWQFSTGRPFSKPYGFDGFILMKGLKDVFEEPGHRRVVYEHPYNGLLPTYHRLDLSAAGDLTLGPVTLTLRGSLINTYDRRNIFFYDVFTLQRADQLPLIPSLSLTVAW